MKVMQIAGKRVAAVDFDTIKDIAKAENSDLGKMKWVDVAKAKKDIKILNSPVSMLKLLALLEDDEYHAACVDAIAKAAISKIECSNKRVTAWIKAAQWPRRQNMIKLLRQMVKYNQACGNGFVIKSRNKKGEWVGMERLLPSQAKLVENHNQKTGYLEPDYIQVKNNKKKYIKNIDVIHYVEETHRSEVWGLASLPVLTNIEILKQIKLFDYNNFKNGLLIDYFIFVQGGSISQNAILDENGDPVIADGKEMTAYDVLEQQIQQASGNKNSHGSILVESEDQNVKIELKPMRPELKDGGWLKLKKDLREGIFAYHRVPPRIVSQLTAGQLGGDNNSDLVLFYENKIKPIQEDIAMLLSEELRIEFGWDIEESAWSFGNIADALKTEDEKLFAMSR